MLKFYPDYAPARVPRLAADILVAFWVVAWAAAGWTVHRVVEALQSVPDGLSGTGQTLNRWIEAFRGAAPLGIPGIGPLFGNVATTLERDSGDQLIALGVQAHVAVDTLALVLALITALPPIFIVGGAYLLWRWRDASEMGAALLFVRSAERGGRIEEARALLAYRALAQLSFGQLLRASPDPVGDVLQHRYDALAAAMLRRAGLESFRLHDAGPPRLPGGASETAPASARDVGGEGEQEYGPRARSQRQEGRFGPGE